MKYIVEFATKNMPIIPTLSHGIALIKTQSVDVPATDPDLRQCESDQYDSNEVCSAVVVNNNEGTGQAKSHKYTPWR